MPEPLITALGILPARRLLLLYPLGQALGTLTGLLPGFSAAFSRLGKVLQCLLRRVLAQGRFTHGVIGD